ncbi:MAG: extracellular solute-binding protein [Anaerolineales bacterium]
MKLKNVFYTAILLILVLASCAPKPAPTTETTPTEIASPVGAAVTPTQAAGTKSLQIIGPWISSEADAFEYVLDGFREKTGIDVTFEGTADVNAPLTTRIAAGNPPDLAILAVAKGLKDLVAQGALIPLDSFANEITSNFSTGWIDQFTIDGHVYAIPTRANIDDCLWFNPEVVTTPPTSWSELLSYCDSVKAEGGNCIAGTGKDVWPLDMTFESIYKATFGLKQWNALLKHEIPWNDPSVVEAFNREAIFYGDKYAAGGSAGALGTGLVDGMARVFGATSDTRFVNAGSWGVGLVLDAINKDLVEGKTIDYVIFPGEPAGDGTILAAADVAVLLVDSPEARALMSYLISTEGQARFAPNGFPVANKNVDPSAYSGLTAKSAGLLAKSEVGPDISTPLSYDFVSQIDQALGAAILDPSSIQSILDNLEANFKG